MSGRTLLILGMFFSFLSARKTLVYQKQKISCFLLLVCFDLFQCMDARCACPNCPQKASRFVYVFVLPINVMSFSWYKMFMYLLLNPFAPELGVKGRCGSTSIVPLMMQSVLTVRTTLLGQNSLITFKARFWQTCFGIMLYRKFRKIKPLLFKIIIILLIIIIYNISIAMFYLFQILSSLLMSPYFFLDVLYVHELPSEHNLCKVSSIECYHKISKQVF